MYIFAFKDPSDQKLFVYVKTDFSNAVLNILLLVLYCLSIKKTHFILLFYALFFAIFVKLKDRFAYRRLYNFLT